MLLNEHAANTAFKTNLEFSHTHFLGNFLRFNLFENNACRRENNLITVMNRISPVESALILIFLN